MDRVKRIWYLSPMRAAKVQASLRIRAVSPEPSLLAHTSSESRGTFRQKARSLAPLNGWACAVKICHDGMLEDTNSLDGAHILQHLYHTTYCIGSEPTIRSLKKHDAFCTWLFFNPFSLMWTLSQVKWIHGPPTPVATRSPPHLWSWQKIKTWCWLVMSSLVNPTWSLNLGSWNS